MRKIFLLIGHRGTGKTSLLERLKNENQSRVGQGFGSLRNFLDLDQEIERGSQKKISEIFEESGEEAFRKLEFDQLTKQLDAATHLDVIALGGGFQLESYFGEGSKNLGQLSKDLQIQKIWIRRKTDLNIKYFLDRPKIKNFSEGPDRAKAALLDRESTYLRWADEQILLPEGRRRLGPIEKAIFFGEGLNLSGCVETLPPLKGRQNPTVKNQIQTRLGWGVSFFELRLDLLDEDELDFYSQCLPAERTLVSLRPGKSSVEESLNRTEKLAFQKFSNKKTQIASCFWSKLSSQAPLSIESKKNSEEVPPQESQPYLDWAMELGVPPKSLWSRIQVFSHHEVSPRDDRFVEFFEQWTRETGGKPHLKWSPLIDRSSEAEKLEACHRWWLEEPSERSLLPRSRRGVFVWYRMLFGPKMKLNFIADLMVSAADQPSLIEWFETPRSWTNFGAVLGSPVEQSWSPEFHKEKFEKENSPFVAIDISQEGFDQGISFLKKLGLNRAAVTSPLKTQALQCADEVGDKGREFRALNTLWLDPTNKWKGENTDIEGAKKLLAALDENFFGKEIVIWGGGGVLPVLQSLLKGAKQIPARLKGAPQPKGPETSRALVWAAGPRELRGQIFPGNEWNFQLIIDLSYSEDSIARKLAIELGADYLSGETWFIKQAQVQQMFWGL